MKKIAKITTALLVANLCFPYSVAENCLAIAEGTDSITVYSLYPTKDSVDGFYMWMDYETDFDRALLNDEKNCYWLRTVPEDSHDASIEDLWMHLYKVILSIILDTFFSSFFKSSHHLPLLIVSSAQNQRRKSAVG